MGAIDVRAETLLEREGISLRGTAQVLEYGAATCRVLEANHSTEEYERLRVNDGKPLNLWRLEFSVHNGSGKDLDHLVAMYSIHSPWPPCTNWDGVSGADWSSTSGHIQRSGRPFSVAAGETLTETRKVLAFHSDAPGFERWSVNYTFAAAGEADVEADSAGLPADMAQISPAQVPAPGVAAAETCEGKPEGAACWKPLSNHANCYVWNDHLYHLTGTWSWSGECKGRVADGAGVLTERLDDRLIATSEGRFQNGKRHGQWVVRWPVRPYVGMRHGQLVVRVGGGGVDEGPYVDGKPDGHWVYRSASGRVDEGPLVDGVKHGRWVERLANGNVREGPFVDGKADGQWVVRYASGRVDEGPLVDGVKQGRWVERLANGNVHEGPFVDGKADGQWVVRYASGRVDEGPVVDGKRHGRWVERLANGIVHEGPFVDGKADGQWVVRYASGHVHEGPKADGKRHGRWVERNADGTVDEGPYVDGKKHGQWVRRKNGLVVEICTWRDGDAEGRQEIGSAR